ncbi:MAG: PT domain-containing protein, partial [Clostridia bacterium]|nr:PT domain-containing protein [Clostridia bacterium]
MDERINWRAGLEKSLSAARRKRLIKRWVAMLSVLVLIATMNQLKLLADTLERVPDCGYEYDHEHDENCYNEDGELTCALHVHTAACFQTRPERTEEEEIAEAPNDDAPDDVEQSDAFEEEAPKYTVGEKNPVLLSEVLKKLKIELNDIQKVEQLADDEIPDKLIRVEALEDEDDFAIYALESFDEAPLAIRADGQTIVILLVRAVVLPTEEPTVEPTAEPTIEPTVEPTAEPTVEPTEEPTAEPTIEPTVEPTAEPTVEPSEAPTVEPTEAPTVEPTEEPTVEPTVEPSEEPTVEPTAEPT